MNIIFNPLSNNALTESQLKNNDDIIFDLRGNNIFAKGVKFYGTDTNTWRDIKINNVSIGSNILDLRNGSNTTLTNTNGIVTINSTWRPVVDNLTSDSTTSSLSAKQGKILKSLINGKSNSGHTHDDRYLKLTGGTMAGNALITFADSGTDKGPQGARGGLYWTGQSDYAKLYAEETVGDNLDLVIQFGDDNSNGLSIRNKANTQTSYISAGGVITTGTFKGNLDWSYITNKPSSYTPSSHTHSWTSITDKLVAGNEFNIVNAGFNNKMWFNHVPINDRSKTATITGYHFGNGATGYTSIKASGFIKNGSSSSYVLLGDGGHKTISSLSVNYANSAGSANTATKLTSSAGNAALPIYFSDGKPVACTASSVFSNLSNSGNNLSITVAGQNRTLTVGYATSAGSTTKVIVNQHTTNDTNYPLVWSNQNNSNNATENQLYKSWSDLYYNPKNKRLTVGGSVVASSFIKSDGTSQQLLRADGGIATFNWSGQSGQPTWLWGGNNQHSYYVYNPSNFRVAYATSSGNADTLDSYHENSFLRYRGATSTDQEATLWDQIGIKQYNNALPDNLTDVYNYGSVISLPGYSSRFEIYASHQSSSGNGLYYRSGWGSDKRTWLKFIDSSNIGSQSVSYASSAGNADTLDGKHAKDFVRAGFYENNNLNSLDTYSFIRSVNSQVSSTSPKGNIGWYNVIQLVHRNGDGDGPNYIGQIALGMTTNVNDIFFRCRRTDPWKTIIHSNNYTEFINNYYWANVKISTSSSTTTSPTVSNLTATSSIKMGNILLENTDEINNSTNGSIHLNYRNSGNVSLCYGGGNVSIGTMSSSHRLYVMGDTYTKGFGIKPCYLSDPNLLKNTISPGDGYTYRCLEIGKSTKISCIIADKVLLSGNLRGYLLNFKEGYDGQIVLLKDLETYGSGNGFFWVMPSGCKIIGSNSSSTYINQNQISDVYDDGESRFFVYSSKYSAWVEFYCG